MVWHDEKPPEFHQILPPLSHRHEKWLLENPEQHAESFEKADQEFDDYRGLDQVEQASLHHDFDIHKHEREHLSYDERVHPHVEEDKSDFTIKHLGSPHDLHPVKVQKHIVEHLVEHHYVDDQKDK